MTNSIIKVAIKNKSVKPKNVLGLPKPITIIYNYNGFGYGVFPLNRDNVGDISSIKDEVARAYSYINLYENMLVETVSPTKTFDFCLEGIKTEKNELIIKTLSGELNTIFWKFLTEKQRIIAQKQLENSIYERLQSDLSKNSKKTLFGLFNSIAYSDSGKERLYRIWSKEDSIADLKLNEDDYAAMAMSLAIFRHPKADEILTKTRAIIENPDRQKRFEFLLPSLSNEETIRDAFMLSLKDEKNREKESWVLVALRNIHHPLRQESAKKHLRFCLDLVDEIQRTGDIFFPKDWLNETGGRYSSEYAFDAVTTFLKENIEFSPILKKKLLQSTDDLYRAQKIKKETE